MLLDLSKIIPNPGASVPFETALDLSDLEFGGTYPVSEPVAASGCVRNTAGVLEMKGSVRTSLHAVCDRCTESFRRELSFPIDAVLVTDADSEDYENPWVFDLQDDSADLDDIVTSVFVLNMPSQLLCRPDCKGLCFRCGANLNLGPCSCKAEPDPRFAALQQFLEKK